MATSWECVLTCAFLPPLKRRRALLCSWDSYDHVPPFAAEEARVLMTPSNDVRILREYEALYLQNRDGEFVHWDLDVNKAFELRAPVTAVRKSAVV